MKVVQFLLVFILVTKAGFGDCGNRVGALASDTPETWTTVSNDSEIGRILRHFLKIEVPAEKHELPNVPVGSFAQFFKFSDPSKAIAAAMDRSVTPPVEVEIYGEMLAWFWLTGQGNIPDGALQSCRSCGSLPTIPVMVALKYGPNDVERFDAKLVVASSLNSTRMPRMYTKLALENADGSLRLEIRDTDKGAFHVTLNRRRSRFRLRRHQDSIEFYTPTVAPSDLAQNWYRKIRD